MSIPEAKQHPPKWKEKVKVGEIYVLEGEDFVVIRISKRGLILRKYNEKR